MVRLYGGFEVILLKARYGKTLPALMAICAMLGVESEDPLDSLSVMSGLDLPQVIFRGVF